MECLPQGGISSEEPGELFPEDLQCRLTSSAAAWALPLLSSLVAGSDTPLSWLGTLWLCSSVFHSDLKHQTQGSGSCRCQVRGFSSKLTSVLHAGVRAEAGMEGRLITTMGATAWDLQLGWHLWAALPITGVSEHPTITITMLRELQAATGNSGHHVMVYGAGNNLPCCGVSGEYP